MLKDGICRGREDFYTKTIAYEDINYSVVDIDAPSVAVIPIVSGGQAHTVQQHPIQQLGVCGDVLEFQIGDQLAGNFEIDKFLFIAVEII